MKKDRNSFFQESQFYQQANVPTPVVVNQPFTTQATANQSFYAGPTPVNYNTQMPQNANYPASTNYMQTDYSEMESRLSKIERQLNRIDARLNKLENQGFFTTEDIDQTTNMYMV